MLEIILTLKNGSDDLDKVDSAIWNNVHQAIFPAKKRDGISNEWIKEQFKTHGKLSLPYNTIDKGKDFIKHFIKDGLLYYNLIVISK